DITIYFNATLFPNSNIISTYERNTIAVNTKSLETSGDVFVGQYALTSGYDPEFEQSMAFQGELTFLNVWTRAFSALEVKKIHRDCYFKYCGNFIAWMEFFKDIKGRVQIEWPSGIRDFIENCPDQIWLNNACGNHCRTAEGPHCKNETDKNVIWHKVKAGEMISQKCPGGRTNGTINRTCQKMETIGIWDKVDYSTCASPFIMNIYEQLSPDRDFVRNHKVQNILEKSRFVSEITGFNLTIANFYSSVDLTLLIDRIEYLTNSLTSQFSSYLEWYASSYEKLFRADIDKTLEIHQHLAYTISNILDDEYKTLWDETYPLGNEFIRVLTSLQHLTTIVIQMIVNNTTISNSLSLGFSTPTFNITTKNLNQTIKIMTLNELKTFIYLNNETKIKITFPLPTISPTTMTKSKHQLNDDKVFHLKYPFINMNITNLFPDDNNSIYIVTITTFRTAHIYIPNLRLGRVSKFDNINSHMVSIDVKKRKLYRSILTPLLSVENLPILIQFGFIKYDNISGNRCNNLNMTLSSQTTTRSSLFRQWEWQSSFCNLAAGGVHDKITINYPHITCICAISNGTFVVTSDMFDPNWRQPFQRIWPFGLFSYLGSVVLMSFSTFTLVMLNYLRVHSSAAYVHKQLALCVCLSQCSMIVSVNGVKNQFMCQLIGALSHYFILTAYSWVMNEAFNLYIQITYTTHQAAGANAALDAESSIWRFLTMGYGIPLGIIILLWLTKKSAYLMPTKTMLCFINIDDWITIMVMIFAAKQQHESAYTKNEKANKAIGTYTGGIWTQLFLITLSWTFAILSFTHNEPIIKILYCFFTSLQGIFLFLSFFLFNDEVRRHYREKRRQRRRIQLMEVPYRVQSLISGTGECDVMTDEDAYKFLAIENLTSSEFIPNETKKIQINSIDLPAPATAATNFFQQLLVKKRFEQQQQQQQQKPMENSHEMKILTSVRKRQSKCDYIDNGRERATSLIIENNMIQDDNLIKQEERKFSHLSSSSSSPNKSQIYSNVNVIRETTDNEDNDSEEYTEEEFRVTVV
ncbi:unnamed protein product, partial [Didymodactylos carnosus]